MAEAWWRELRREEAEAADEYEATGDPTRLDRAQARVRDALAADDDAHQPLAFAAVAAEARKRARAFADPANDALRFRMAARCELWVARPRPARASSSSSSSSSSSAVSIRRLVAAAASREAALAELHALPDDDVDDLRALADPTGDDDDAAFAGARAEEEVAELAEVAELDLHAHQRRGVDFRARARRAGQGRHPRLWHGARQDAHRHGRDGRLARRRRHVLASAPAPAPAFARVVLAPTSVVGQWAREHRALAPRGLLRAPRPSAPRRATTSPPP